jgi:hypothetical protein
MKQLIAYVLLACSVTLSAQIEKPITKGNRTIGGSAGLGFGEEYLTVSLSPSMGFFLTDGLLLGFSPNMGFSRNFGDYEHSDVDLGLGVFLRYYFRVGVYLRLSTAYGFTYRRDITYDYTDRYHRFYLGPGVGYAWFLNEKVSLDFFLRESVSINANTDELGGSATVSYNAYLGAGFTLFL